MAQARPPNGIDLPKRAIALVLAGGRGSRLMQRSDVEWSVLLPEVEVGRRVRLKRVVVDRGCRIPGGLVTGEDAELDAQRFFRTPTGITLVTLAMLAALPS